MEQYWYNTKTNQVEVGKQSLAVFRIGPFSTRAEAERAYEILQARAEQWEEEDQE